MQFHRDVAAHYQYQEHRARSSNKLYTFILITIVWRGRTQVELLKVDKMSFNPDVRGFFGLLGCAPQPHHPSPTTPRIKLQIACFSLLLAR